MLAGRGPRETDEEDISVERIDAEGASDSSANFPFLQGGTATGKSPGEGLPPSNGVSKSLDPL